MDVLSTVPCRIRHEFKIREVNWRAFLANLLVSVSLSYEKNGMFFYRIKLG